MVTIIVTLVKKYTTISLGRYVTSLKIDYCKNTVVTKDAPKPFNIILKDRHINNKNNILLAIYVPHHC